MLNDDDAKTVTSAAMKEKLSQDEDEEILGAEEARQYKSLAATLNHMSLDRSEGTENGRSISEKLERSHESSEVLERSSKGDVADAGMGDRRCGERRRARGLGLSRKKIDERKYDDDERNSGRDHR